MPRKRAADRVGPIKTRTRTGCKECRSSRVRCDEKKPTCSRCCEKRLVCSTPLVLKWESEFVSRGQAFGRAGIWNKSRAEEVNGESKFKKPLPPSPTALVSNVREWCSIPPIRSWSFVNSGVPTFEQPHQVPVAADDPNAVGFLSDACSHGDRQLLLDFNNENDDDGRDISPFESLQLYSPEPERPLSFFPHASESVQNRLFEYYLQQVCPRTTASSKSLSPFASVILPFTVTASPTLFKAIQALGACHLSRFNPNYHAVGLRSKSGALRDLRYQLSMKGAISCSVDPEVLVVMMMLCLCEIVDNCDQHWTIHLKGAKELIRLRRRQNTALGQFDNAAQSQDPVSAFAESFFAFQDVMGRTACGEEVLFGSDYWQKNERTVDLWMGCSPELVSIVSSITELSRTRRQAINDTARSSFSLRAAGLARRLENLVQEVDNSEDRILGTAAELKRLAALLYLHSALYGASPSTPLVVGYVRRILKHVSDLLDCGSMASMTWPVFVAAVELDPLHDEVWSDSDRDTVAYGRPLVLRALAAMAESTVSNVARTRAVIAKVWQARDLDMLKGSSAGSSSESTACNDWEWYVAPISTAMSLA